MIRYSITYIDQHKFRRILGPNQGRCFFENPELAIIALKSFLENNSENTLKKVYGAQSIGTFEISEIDCYENGDTKSIYVDANDCGPFRSVTLALIEIKEKESKVGDFYSTDNGKTVVPISYEAYRQIPPGTALTFWRIFKT